MSTEKFDKRLRNLFSQYEARIDRSDWERMNAYLQAQNRRRKRNIFFSLLMLMMTVPYFLSAFYKNSTQLESRLPLGVNKYENPVLALKEDAIAKVLADVEAKEDLIIAKEKDLKGTKLYESVSPERTIQAGGENSNQAKGTKKPGSLKSKKSDPLQRTAKRSSLKEKEDKVDPEEMLTESDLKPVLDSADPALSDSTEKVIAEQETVQAAKDSIELKESGTAVDKAKSKKILSPIPRFMVSLRFTPGMASVNKSVRSGREKQVHEDYDNVRAQEKNRLGFESSIDFSYRLLSNLSLRSGVNYRLSGQHNVYDYKIEKIPVIDAASKNIIAYIQVKDTSDQNRVKADDRSSFSWVSIPLAASWQFPLGPRLSLRIETGVEGSFLASANGNQASQQDLQRKKFTANDFERFTWGYNLNAAFIFPLSANFSAAICPSYSKLSDFSKKESTLQSSSSQVGLGFSLMFNLSSIIH